MLFEHPFHHVPQQKLDDRAGDLRERRGRLVHRDQVLQGLHRHLKPEVSGPGGHLLDPFRGIPPARQTLIELPGQLLPLRDRQEERWIQHRLQEPRVACQDVGHAGGAAHHDGYEVEQPSVGSEHGEEGEVFRQARQEPVHASHGAVRVGRLAQGVDDLVEDLADDRASPFRSRWTRAVLPPIP